MFQQNSITSAPRARAYTDKSCQNRFVVDALQELWEANCKRARLIANAINLQNIADSIEGEFTIIQAAFDDDQRPGRLLDEMSAIGVQYLNLRDLLKQANQEIEDIEITIQLLKTEVVTLGGVSL